MNYQYSSATVILIVIFFREHTELAGQTIGAFLEKVCSLVTTPPGDYTIFLLIVPLFRL